MIPVYGHALPQVRGYLRRTRDTVANYSVGRISRTKRCFSGTFILVGPNSSSGPLLNLCIFFPKKSLSV